MSNLPQSRAPEIREEYAQQPVDIPAIAGGVAATFFAYQHLLHSSGPAQPENLFINSIIFTGIALIGLTGSTLMRRQLPNLNTLSNLVVGAGAELIGIVGQSVGNIFFAEYELHFNLVATFLAGAGLVRLLPQTLSQE